MKLLQLLNVILLFAHVAKSSCVDSLAREIWMPAFTDRPEDCAAMYRCSYGVAQIYFDARGGLTISNTGDGCYWV